MINLYMTAYSGRFVGPIAEAFGFIMNWIYTFFEGIFGVGNVNIALIIVIFTVFVNTLLLPLTYKQQKFSALQRVIQPELSEIQKKYKGKRDQASMMKQQEETQALYDKYGISMTGSCVQLFIQLPILYALYGVFNNIPAYIVSIKNMFTDLVVNVQATEGYRNILAGLYDSLKLSRLRIDFLEETLSESQLGNFIIDFAYKLNDSGWEAMRNAFPGFANVISTTQAELSRVNYLFVLNISDTPSNIIVEGWKTKAFGLIFAALLIPIFSYLSQLVSIKLASASSGNSNDAVAQQMKTMNTVMPLISLFFVISVPIGLGIYWIASAVIRTIYMLILNAHFKKLDLEKIIEKNREKAAAKKKKRDANNEKIAASATLNTKRKSMSEKANIGNESQTSLEEANEMRMNAKAGSMASKANLVAEFNRKNNKK